MTPTPSDARVAELRDYWRDVAEKLALAIFASPQRYVSSNDTARCLDTGGALDDLLRTRAELAALRRAVRERGWLLEDAVALLRRESLGIAETADWIRMRNLFMSKAAALHPTQAAEADIPHNAKHDGSCEDWCHRCRQERAKAEAPPWSPPSTLNRGMGVRVRTIDGRELRVTHASHCDGFEDVTVELPEPSGFRDDAGKLRPEPPKFTAEPGSWRAARGVLREDAESPAPAGEAVPSVPEEHNGKPAHTLNVCAIRRKSDGYWWECSPEHGAGWNDKRIRQAWTFRAAVVEIHKRKLEGVEIVELAPAASDDGMVDMDAPCVVDADYVNDLREVAGRRGRERRYPLAP